MRVRAIRFEQNGRIFYTAVLPAAEAIRMSRVDVWSADIPTEDGGYQRTPSTSRVRSVASYVAGNDAILPLGGLLNARAAHEDDYGSLLPFEADTGQDEEVTSGWLTIPASTALYVVDMQHRLGGIQHAIENQGRSDLAAFPVVVTIADGLSKMEEIEQFELINTTQKKVRTDLARRLLAIQAKTADKRVAIDRRGRLWEARGPLLAAWLNNHGTVWKHRILPPNKSKADMPNAVAREISFVTSLKPILQTPLFQRMAEEQVAVVVDRYWEAVGRIFPEAFDRPNDHVIQKTAGMFSLHSLAPEVVELVRSSGDDLNADNFETAIKVWTDLGSVFWASDNEEGAVRYGGMRGYMRLAAELRSYLPELEFELI